MTLTVNGFTLLEVMISLLLLSIVLLGVDAAQVVVKICFPTAIVSAFPASGFLFAEADAGGTHGGGFPASDEASCAMKTANAITIPPREGLDMCRLY